LIEPSPEYSPLVVSLSAFGFQGAFCEIDFFFTAGAKVLLFEFIRKDFFFFSATWALADKGLQVLEVLKSWAM